MYLILMSKYTGNNLKIITAQFLKSYFDFELNDPARRLWLFLNIDLHTDIYTGRPTDTLSFGLIGATCRCLKTIETPRFYKFRIKNQIPCIWFKI